MRIGIDVGGTHTDAVLMDGMTVVASHKALTSADVREGIVAALDAVLKAGDSDAASIDAVMIGTTHFTNAIIQRRGLTPAAIIRACLPTGSGLPPLCDWPEDMLAAVGGNCYMVAGGHRFDGREISPLDGSGLDRVISDIKARGITAVAIAAAFSPADPTHELEIARRLQAQIPRARVTLSHQIGRLGILERENAALLNAALSDLAGQVVASMQTALTERGMGCPLFVSQNDGTLMSADYIARYPALTFSSGPTNSLRGAAVLSGIRDAIVVDIGGTTTDIGVLDGGFPRESNSYIDVGGVRTNFRMPDIMAIGLGGGSLVDEAGSAIGPQSVGHNLVREGLVFGGDVLTATDIAVANGSLSLGDAKRVAGLGPELVERATVRIHRMLDDAIDRMRPSADPVPVILVGGGSVLVCRPLSTASRLIIPDHAGVANAIGAAIAQVGGEAEHIVSYSRVPRQKAISAITEEARDKAIAAGAEPATLRVLDMEETAMSYMDDDAARVRIKVVGELNLAVSP